MNVARLNFSHGSYENHALLIKNIRAVSAKLKVPVAIMQDLQGPKIRVSELKKPLDVKRGRKLTIGQHIHLDFDISESVKPKQRILIEDGLIELKVLKTRGKKIFCEVVTGGKIQSHKGVNLPDTKARFDVITAKDVEDLKFGLNQNVDYVALSFVRHGRDVVVLKRLIKKNNPKGNELPKVIAKIERKEALDAFKDILHESDGIMVARGDLGVEIADSAVPIAQKQIIRDCLHAAKPVIVATQMLDSMIRNPRPTRAEVSDVANAVLDRADAVMLSGESATGKYPVEAVTEMTRIIEEIEQSPFTANIKEFAGAPDPAHSRAAAIAESAGELDKAEHAKAIITATDTGFSARVIAHRRPHAAIVTLTDHQKIYRQLCLLWGAVPVLVPRFPSFSQLMSNYITVAKKMKLVKKGDRVVLVAGEPLGQKMNLVELKTVR